MGAPKGHGRYGGRKKGTPNKKGQALADKAASMGIDPFEVVLLYAKGDWKSLGYDSSVYVKESADGSTTTLGYVISPELRAKCAQDACQYLHPKRKAIEIKAELNLDDPLDDLSDEELDDL